MVITGMNQWQFTVHAFLLNAIHKNMLAEEAQILISLWSAWQANKSRVLSYVLGGLEGDISYGISYEQLNAIIERVLRDHDYYSMAQKPPQPRQRVTSPLAAISQTNYRR